jgi:outer membrane protein TolC
MDRTRARTRAKLFVIVATVVFFGVGSASARNLTWHECLELTLAGNADLRQAEAAFRATENLEGVARAGFLPTVSGTLSATRSGSSGSTDYTTPPGTSYSASLQGSENLFSGFYDRANLDRAKANTRAAEATFQIAKAKLSYDLKSAYESLRFSQSALELAIDIVKRRQRNLDLVQLRFESGRENKGSVLLSKAYLGDARLGSLTADHDQDTARATLSRVVGFEESDETLVASEDVPISTPPLKDPDFRTIATATPDHVQAIAQESAADSGVTVARSGFFPSLALSGNYGRRDDHFFPGEPNRWTLGLSLNIPIFNGLKDYSSTKSAVATYQSSMGNRASVDRGLLVKLRQAFHTYVEAVARLDVDASYRDAALLRAEIARTQYNNGLITFTDWDLIENDLIARQKSYLQSTRDRVTAEAAWEQSQGTGVIP